MGRKTSNVYTRTSAAANANGNSDDLRVGEFDCLAFDADVTALTGSAPTIAFHIDRKGSDGIYYPIYSPAAVSAVGKVSAHLGPLQNTNVVLGDYIRLRWVIGGTGGPVATFSASIQGQR